MNMIRKADLIEAGACFPGIRIFLAIAGDREEFEMSSAQILEIAPYYFGWLVENNIVSNDLSNESMFGANLPKAKLSGANLYCAGLASTNFAGANLFEANLSGADLSYANLTGADLTGANLLQD